MARKLSRFDVFDSVIEDLMDQRRQHVKFVCIGEADTSVLAKLCRYWREQTDGKFEYVSSAVVEQDLRRMKSAGADVTVLPYPPVLDGTQGIPDIVFIAALGDDWEEIWKTIMPGVGKYTKVFFDGYYEGKDDKCRELIQYVLSQPAWSVVPLFQPDLPGEPKLVLSCRTSVFETEDAET